MTRECTCGADLDIYADDNDHAYDCGRTIIDMFTGAIDWDRVQELNDEEIALILGDDEPTEEVT